MRLEKVFSRPRKAVRSQGAYLGSDVAVETDFRCAIAVGGVVADLELLIAISIEAGAIRRLFHIISSSGVREDGGLELLFTSLE